MLSGSWDCCVCAETRSTCLLKGCVCSLGSQCTLSRGWVDACMHVVWPSWSHPGAAGDQRIIRLWEIYWSCQVKCVCVCMCACYVCICCKSRTALVQAEEEPRPQCTGWWLVDLHFFCGVFSSPAGAETAVGGMELLTSNNVSVTMSSNKSQLSDFLPLSSLSFPLSDSILRFSSCVRPHLRSPLRLPLSLLIQTLICLK